MKSHADKIVAVVDPIWVGHHPMYFAQFAASFLRRGARVIALCPDPTDARREISDAVDAETAASLDERVIFRKLEIGSRSFLKGRFEGDPWHTTMRWRRTAALLAEAEHDFSKSADLVYFPYLDTYLRFLPIPLAPEIILGRPWSGLYLRNHHFGNPSSPKQSLVMLAKGDALLRSDSCLGIGVLDERFIPAMESYTGKSTAMFPDFTDTSLPAEPVDLAREIVTKAAGSKIVGMIGLERRKGILTLLRTAELARKRGLPLYFACAGRIFPSEFSAEEWSWIESLDRSNLHLDTGAVRIPTEAGFNSVFSTFDIAWAAYENFQGSSNTLGKAAAFGIPCIASKSGCIGHRVENYRSGLTIPEGDVEEAIAALTQLADQGQMPEPRYEDFRKDHSIARLDELLGGLLERL